MNFNQLAILLGTTYSLPQLPPIAWGVGIVLLIIFIIVFLYIFAHLKAIRKNPEVNDPNSLLTEFRNMRDSGEISSDEYRNIISLFKDKFLNDKP